MDGAYWSLAPLMPGEAWLQHDPHADQRRRGRLLAEFHLAVKDLNDLPQRPGWRPTEEILADQRLERAFQNCPDAAQAHLYLWHLHRARELAERLAWSESVNHLIHGDFIPQNLLQQAGELSGLLNFELSHINQRMEELCLSWRGLHDQLVHAYHEVSPLTNEEWRMLTPAWWAHLLAGAYHNLQHNRLKDEWTQGFISMISQ